MIDLIKQKVTEYPGSKEDKYNYLRELLQLYILRIIDEANYFQKIAFVGGTALRIIYDLERFSEDLDFSLIKKADFSFSELAKKISFEMEHASINMTTKIKEKPAVCIAQFKFQNILHETSLSKHKDEVIMIKLEVDCHPPEGYNTAFTMHTKDVMIAINHFDLPSLFAGKLHAILQRKYTKGRDYYDYLWYHGHKIAPNFIMLNNALKQTTGKYPDLDRESLKKALYERFSQTNYTLVKNDIEPFLKNKNELRFFEKEIFLKTL